MKTNIKLSLIVITCTVLLAGCCTVTRKYNTGGAEAAAAPEAANPTGTSIVYFPSGRADCSGLSIEKNAPPEVVINQPFDYTYKVSNLTDVTLENVTVMDRVSSNFTMADSDPKANNVANGIGTWNIGTLGPKESRIITIHGSGAEEGTITSCCWATYNPVACLDIHVVRASIALTKTAPAEVVICDQIATTLTVQNSGSSALTGVHVTDTLPNGLTSDGKSTLDFDVGKLGPGETKDLKYNATASAPGKYTDNAVVSAAEGVTNTASATTTVHQPVLAVSCKVPEQEFISRNFDVTYTVNNTGDAPAAGTKLQVAVPAGLTVVSASANGQTSGGNVVWDLGSVEANSPQNVTATLVGATAGTFSVGATAQGTCAQAVSSSCDAKVVGLAALMLNKWDDPDPVAVGSTTTYTCKVTNQGSADAPNVQVVIDIDPLLVPINTTDGTISGQRVTMPVIPDLGPGKEVTYKVVAKGVTPGNAITKFTMTSDILTRPVLSEESTHVF